MNRIAALILLSSIFGFSVAPAKSSELRVSVSNGSNVLVVNEAGRRVYSLNQNISQYKVNCLKSRILVFGAPKNISSNAPQVAYISLIDVKNKKVLYSGILGSGVREARYPKSGEWALIHTNLAFFISLKNGNRKYADELYDPETFSEETCEEMPVVNVK
ncbi:hypothetical protein [Variovorax sp. 54]|uniref:hypothetical protein n=1 Tax=Variovorax sp. 54 TaxID=2035212 RepID=UPI0011808EF8|nr:hypothetical protein [Variovorax sp. 54]